MNFNSSESDLHYRRVPWYSMAEWQLVYQQVYSPDIDDKKKAYRRLLIWKAKAQNLPAGVECTLGILQVRLREMELTQMNQSLISEEDLQLMYSTAIIRFLNLITELQQSRIMSTLYCKAQDMDIPPWIVNLRHDAAHSHILPPLHSLKSAADFIFNWLNDHYWKNEAEHCFDYYINIPPTKTRTRQLKRIETLLNCYQQLMSDPSDQVSPSMLTAVHRCLPIQIDPAKRIFTKQILENITKYIKIEKNKQELLTLIVENTNFLILPGVDSDYDVYKTTWTHILTILNHQELLIDFVKLLLIVINENSPLSRNAALWINEICKGYTKLDKYLSIKCELMKNKNYGKDFTNNHLNDVAKKLVDRKFTKLQKAITLEGNLPKIFEFKEVITRALKSPSENTFIFLDSLCVLCGIPKPNLVNLVSIYINNPEGTEDIDPKSSKKSEVFTLENILKDNYIIPEVKEDSSIHMIHTDKENLNKWTLAKDKNWLNCPLGAVPSKELNFIEFDQLENEM